MQENITDDRAMIAVSSDIESDGPEGGTLRPCCDLRGLTLFLLASN